MKQRLTSICAALLLIAALSGCRHPAENDEAYSSSAPPPQAKQTEEAAATAAAASFDFEVDPQTFALTIIKDGRREPASLPLPKAEVTDLVDNGNSVSWTYPGQISVKINKRANYLDIVLESAGASQFSWPSVKADRYMLPLGEGKQIPASDPNWLTFLNDRTYTWSESFSMDFFVLNADPYSIVYVVTNKFNNDIHFDASSSLAFQFTHRFPSLNPDRSYGFRLYVTGSDPLSVVQPYKAYVQERGNFATLEDKAADNPNIRKLYGAPQIYLWSGPLVADGDVDWPKLRQLLPDSLGPWLVELLSGTADGSAEFAEVLRQIPEQDDLDRYQKRVVLSALNQGIRMRGFYSPAVFPNPGREAQAILAQGIGRLSEEKLYDLNKLLLKSAARDAVSEPAEWGQAGSTALIRDIRSAGIEKAWIGLPSWADGLLNPALIDEAVQDGYLVAPYDSYHSIQQTADPSWNTASFPHASLYEEASITKQDGTKVAGFLGRGRKLNSTLAMPAVEQRVTGILQDGIGFNSWFVDCDATGEIYDDYSPDHPTTQQQDLNSRIERLRYFAADKMMVVGSEGGNDYAGSVIAFAHGIENPIIAWDDPDMRSNSSSPYYVGGYYSADGIPARYGKAVPIKPLYEQVYTSPVYSLPLYKLVYNNSVITTNHWEWGSYKIKGGEASQMLHELLYNVPPLYHLNREAWESQQASILDFLKVWAPYHRQAVTREMSEFTVLTEDRLVQRAAYGADIAVTVNFSDREVNVDGEALKAQSAVLEMGTQRVTFDAGANAGLLAP